MNKASEELIHRLNLQAMVISVASIIISCTAIIIHFVRLK